MNVDWTFVLATYAAVVASATGIRDGLGIRESRRAKRARGVGEVRPLIRDLQDRVEAARQQSYEMGRHLGNAYARTTLNDLRELQRRLCDDELIGLIETARALCNEIAATPTLRADQVVPHNDVAQLGPALDALAAVLNRCNQLEREA